VKTISAFGFRGFSVNSGIRLWQKGDTNSQKRTKDKNTKSVTLVTLCLASRRLLTTIVPARGVTIDKGTFFIGLA
jgi:hypothetical protein